MASIWRSPRFLIRIETPIGLPTSTKKEVFDKYHSDIDNFAVTKLKVNSKAFTDWKRQLKNSGGYKKQMVSVCSLLYKTYNGKTNIDLNSEARAQVAAALYYAFEPVDVIPDYVPETGYLDDVYCINLCLSKLGGSQMGSCPELWEEVKNLLERL